MTDAEVRKAMRQAVVKALQDKAAAATQGNARLSPADPATASNTALAAAYTAAAALHSRNT